MEKFSLSDYNLQTKVLWWLMLLSSLSIFGAAVYGMFSFSIAQLMGLCVALVVSALVNQHHFAVPRTKINFTAREFITFWGIIWLGIPGGVLLAAGMTAIQARVESKNKNHLLLEGFTNVIAAFAAGSVFYFVLKVLADFREFSVNENPLAFGWLAVAVIALALTHQLFSILLNALTVNLENGFSISKLKQTFIASTGTYVLSVVAAFVLHLTFLQFGWLFGLVILPITVFGHLAYRLHVSRFELKTKEITEASRVHLATVEALATAIDARDQVGAGHVQRTQIYAVGIGEILELSTAEIHALNAGALLHDIGKLAVPDHILNKPGRLTPAEMEKAKIHATVGASILEKVDFPYPVVPTVKYHHEAWDGTGYPEGLKGENIPLTARILSIADAFDTLRGARPYRAAVPREDARRFLLNGSGTQFDPKIVDIFLRNLSKFEKEIERQNLAYVQNKESITDVHNTLEDEIAQSYVEQIKRANREVFTLYELARVFGSSLNLDETLSLFVKKIGELVPFDTCIVYLMDETGESAKTTFIEGEHRSALKNKQIKIGEGATGYVLKTKKPVHKIEPGLDFTFNEFDLSQNYTAMASLPLISDEKLVGAVSLYSCELENYEEEHMRLLETVSRIASDAICVSLQHAETESKALTDPMTNLPNARSLQMQFEKETARAKRSGTSFHLLMLDLDGFKAVNDTFGHKAGDKLLKELARVIKGQLRDYDFLARYAGDEFVAIVPETENSIVRDLCQRIEKAVDEFILPLGEGKCARVGISVGTGCFPNHGSTLDQILAHADKAMYAVKAHRKKSRVTQILPPINKVVSDEDFNSETDFIVELDESHIVSSALN